MRNAIILNTLIIFMCLTSTNLMAQLDKTTLSFGGGQFLKKTILEKTGPINNFGGSTISQKTTTFTPHFALTWERRIHKSLSIGGGFHYLTAQSNMLSTLTFAGGTTTNFQQGTEATMGGLSFNPKLFLYSDSDFDVYVGAALAFLMTSESSSSGNNVSGVNQVNFTEQYQRFRTLLDVNIGGRCFFTENLGFYGEVGFVSIYLRKAMAGQAGIIYRF
jgi:hypothetical protein